MRGDIMRDALRGRWLLAAGSVACMVVSTIGYAMAVPLAGHAVDALLAGTDARPAVVGALAGALAGCVCWSLSDVLLAEVVTTMSVRLRARMVTHTLALPVGFFTDRSVGEITDRLSTDVDTVAKGVLSHAKPLGMGVLGAIAALVASTTVDHRLTLLFIPACAAISLAGWRAGRRVAATNREVQGEWAEAAGTAEEAFGARDDLRQALGRGLIMRRWAEHTLTVTNHSGRLVRARNRLTLATIGSLRAFQTATLVLGAVLAARGDIGVGGVWAAFGLVTLFSTRIEDVLQNLPRLTEAVAAGQRVGELLDEPPEQATTATDELGTAVRWQEPVAVVLDRVTFAYGDGPIVLDDVSLTVRPGRSLAVVGRTGSGKTTLARLVTRSLEPAPGTVFIDGVDVGAVPLRELRRNVGVISQRVEILQASLRDNVALFDPAITDERITAAFELLGLSGWLAALPAGLDSQLTAGGVSLSAGEQQLVAFARLLVRSPAVVVLDEATARLDPATEAVLQRAAERLLAGRTAIIIAHRLATIAGVDDVVVLDDGRVVEHGPRRALLADPASHFARLVEADGGAPAAQPVPGPAVTVTRRRAGGDGPGDGTDLDERADRAVSAAPGRRPYGVVGTALLMLARSPRLSIPGAAGWCVYFVMPAVAAWLWTGMLPTLEAGGSVATPIVAFALVGAVGLGGRLVGAVYFTRWWNRSHAVVRSNILAAQLHPHDDRAGRRPESPGDAISRMWDTHDLCNYSDHFIDLLSVVVFVVTATSLTGRWSTLPWLAAPVVIPVTLTLLLYRPIKRVAVEHARLRSGWSGQVADVCGAATAIKGFACEDHAARHLDGWTRRRQRAALVQRRLELTVVGSVFATTATGQRLVLALLAFSATAVTAERVGVAVTVAEGIALMPLGGYISCILLVEAPMVRAKLARMARLLPDREDFDLTRPPGDFRVPPVPPAPVPTARRDRAPLARVQAVGLRVVHGDGTVALADGTFEVRAGELVVVTGPVASGKSTLLRLLAGLERADAGGIWWNGEPVSDPSRFLRPPNCAYVAQTPRLLSGTVTDNVALDHDVDVMAALALAELDEDVARAGGTTTVVGHRGLRLSGGQAQRLATARAVAADTELLVLDDLSSALDVLTEQQVWRNLRTAGRTVVASSYKQVALDLADRVVVLHEGRVVAEGPWSELERDHGHLLTR
jgi:ATP-binding cassette subfamily B protein